MKKLKSKRKKQIAKNALNKYKKAFPEVIAWGINCSKKLKLKRNETSNS